MTPKPGNPGSQCELRDLRKSQLIEPRRTDIAPEWAKLKKDDHPTIPGTRIQSLPGGVAVRVIIEDGKHFPPHKLIAAKKYLKLLVARAHEKAEIARMISETSSSGWSNEHLASKEPVLAAPLDVLPARSHAHAKSEQTSSAATGRLSKKERKHAEWKERQQKLVETQAAKLQETGREIVCAHWFEGEVVQRSKGRAWVKVNDAAQMPAQVRERLRVATAEIRSELAITDCDVLPICFADVTDATLDLKPGAALHFKIFTDKQDVGGCEAKAPPPTPSGTKRAADGIPETNTKRTKNARKKAAAERRATEQATTAGVTPDKMDAEMAVAEDKVSAEQVAAEKAVAAQVPAEKALAEKAAAEKLDVEEKAVALKKSEEAQAAAEKAAADKVSAEKKAADEKAVAEKPIAEEHASAEKVAAETAAAEKAAAQKAVEKVLEKKAAEKKVAEEKAAAEKKVEEQVVAEKTETCPMSPSRSISAADAAMTPESARRRMRTKTPSEILQSYSE